MNSMAKRWNPVECIRKTYQEMDVKQDGKDHTLTKKKRPKDLVEIKDADQTWLETHLLQQFGSAQEPPTAVTCAVGNTDESG